MKNWHLAAVLTLWAVAMATLFHGKSLSHRFTRSPVPDVTCNVIHKPTGGCPDGYTEEQPSRFTEKDGTKIAACIWTLPAPKEDCIDEIRPGETVDLQFMIVIPPEDQPVGAPSRERRKN